MWSVLRPQPLEVREIGALLDERGYVGDERALIFESVCHLDAVWRSTFLDKAE